MKPKDSVLDIGLTRHKKVMVVDDEQTIASLIEDWLSESFEVTVAYTGHTAIEKIKWSVPDIILLDVVMPDMSGFDVVRSLQEIHETRDVPIIIMTAKNFADSTLRMIMAEGNVKGFLSKPFSGTELKREISECLAGRKKPLPSENAGKPVPPPQAASFDAPRRAEPAAVPSAARSVPQAETFPVASHPEFLRTKEVGGSIDVGGPPHIRLWRWVRASTAAPWIGVGLAAALAAFLAAEGICRLTEKAVGAEILFPPQIAASRWPGVPFEVPGRQRWTQGGVLYQLNSWGLRDQPLALSKSPGNYRIYLMGGSNVFGTGVPDDVTVAKLLGKILNRSAVSRESGAFRYEVINGGLWGYTPQQQWEHFKKVSVSFKPDLIIWLAETRLNEPVSGAWMRFLVSLPSFIRYVPMNSHFLRVLQAHFFLDDEGTKWDSRAAFDEAKSLTDLQGIGMIFALCPNVPFHQNQGEVAQMAMSYVPPDLLGSLQTAPARSSKSFFLVLDSSMADYYKGRELTNEGHRALAEQIAKFLGVDNIK